MTHISLCNGFYIYKWTILLLQYALCIHPLFTECVCCVGSASSLSAGVRVCQSSGKSTKAPTQKLHVIIIQRQKRPISDCTLHPVTLDDFINREWVSHAQKTVAPRLEERTSFKSEWLFSGWKLSNHFHSYICFWVFYKPFIKSTVLYILLSPASQDEEGKIQSWWKRWLWSLHMCVLL